MDGRSAGAAEVGPGICARVVVCGTAVLDRAVGVRRVGDDPAPLGPDSAFRIASLTKQFTAAAVMSLIDEGRLSLETPLSEVIPSLPQYTHAITLRHLLTHTSGLPNYETLMPNGYYTAERQIDDEGVVQLLESTDAAPLFAAGHRWAYSNSGFVLLGKVVERRSGTSFGEFLRRRIFAPAGMTATVVHVPGADDIPERAFGHEPAVGGGFCVADQSATSATSGDGGVYSTLNDMDRWLRALQSGEYAPIRPNSGAFEPVRLDGGMPTTWPVDTTDEDNLDPGGPVAYGFGWFLDPAFGLPRRWHFGSTQGFRTAIDWFPDQHVTSIVLCNRTDIDARAMALQNARSFLP